MKAGWRRRLLLRVVFYSLAVFLAIPLALSQVMLRPAPQPVHPPPAGYELGQVWSEGLKLRTWTRRGTPGCAAVVIVHGLGDTLESYLEPAEVLHRRGHTVLLLDLRGHGGSEGTRITMGGREREDVRAALDHLRKTGLAEAGLVLLGHSMGAVAVLRAAADQPDVRAVVVEAPYDTYRETVYHHARLFYGLPRWVPVLPIAVALAEWRGGFRADDVDAVAAARRLRASLLAIVDGADPRMPEAVVRRVYDAHPGPKRIWVAPGVDHLGAILLPEYWPRVLAFLDESGV